VAMTVAPLVLLALHTVLQRRAILRGVVQQQAREARMRAARAQQEAA
ncbi:heme exporter protein CcmD, partial [Salmonella enterica]|nr:heme exporter protein CcmD [Salmonella enterica]HCT0265997.1 heme exporter protein CcmD [Salmonella enterica subsp. enterica serovar Braenderup]